MGRVEGLRKSRWRLSIAFLSIALAACSSSPPRPTAPGGAGDPSARTLSTSSSINTPLVAATGPALSCPAAVFSSLTTAQRVGQLFALGLANDHLGSSDLAAIHAQHMGSVWFTQTSSAGVSAIRVVSDAVQAQATSANTGGVRFYVAANQEGGLIQALQGPGFSTIPSALSQGQLTPAVLQQDATRWGQQLSAAGVNLDLAPVMDVVPLATASQNQPIGALDREFGHNPTIVANHGVAFIRGMATARVATTAKHFPGLGRVVGNTDTTAGVTDTVTTPTDPYLASFKAAVQAGVPFVMVSLATYTKIDPAHLAAFSPTVMRLLRGMGFHGVIVSDDLGATVAVADIPPAQRAFQFLAGEGDLIVSKTVAPAVTMAKAVLARTSTDPVFAKIVDSAVRFVLQAKYASGLLPC